MELPIPDADQTLQDLSTTIKVAVDSTVDALQEARAYFAGRREEVPDSKFAPGLVRYLIKGHLSQREHRAVEMSEDDPYTFEALSNNGLLLSALVGEILYRIRILKGDSDNPDSGYLPPPGSSGRKQDFYAQKSVQLSFFLDGMVVKPTEEEGPQIVNLVLAWHVNRVYELQGIWLVCPKSGGTTLTSTSIHWFEQIQDGEPESAWDAYKGPADDVDDLDLGDDDAAAAQDDRVAK